MAPAEIENPLYSHQQTPVEGFKRALAVEAFWHQDPNINYFYRDSWQDNQSCVNQPHASFTQQGGSGQHKTKGSSHMMTMPRRSKSGRSNITFKYPNDLVDILLDSEKVGEIPIRTLIRFSAHAAEMFPRPSQPTVVVPIAPNKKYDILLPGNPWLPSIRAVQIVLHWMTLNQYFRNGEPPTNLVPPRLLPHINLDDLVDTFAVGLALDLRPKDVWYGQLKVEINTRLTISAPQIYQFRLIRECLPVDEENVTPPVEPILQRLVTSYLENIERGVYVKQELQVIEAYVEHDGEFLRSKINECRRHREKQSWTKTLQAENLHTQSKMGLDRAIANASAIQTNTPEGCASSNYDGGALVNQQLGDTIGPERAPKSSGSKRRRRRRRRRRPRRTPITANTAEGSSKKAVATSVANATASSGYHTGDTADIEWTRTLDDLG